MARLLLCPTSEKVQEVRFPSRYIALKHRVLKTRETEGHQEPRMVLTHNSLQEKTTARH